MASNKENLRPYMKDTVLTGYFPVPNEVLKMGLPSTAVLVYGILLGRATLSQKTGYNDLEGRIYVVYPIEKIAETMGKGTTAVKRALKQLEQAGLIQRRRETGNSFNTIFLRFPTGCFPTVRKEPVQRSEKRPSGSPKRDRPTDRKAPLIYRREQQNENDYYQYDGDDSL